MMKCALFSIVILLVIAVAKTTEVQKCKGSKAPKVDSADIKISSCTKPRCILRRKTNAHIEMNIRPDKDIKKLRQDISAEILGIPLPFPGVDGTSACDNMYDAEGKNKVGCPLKAGESYIYKTSFPVLEFYPTVNLLVHWALNDGQNDEFCFEVPAKIK